MAGGPFAQELFSMAIRQRKGRRKPWEVYWNNPFTLKRESLYVETEEEAKKQDALKKYQLKFERDMFRREETQPLKIEHTFESAYYLFLKDRRFSESALKRHLESSRKAIAFLGNTPLEELDGKLKAFVDVLILSGIRTSTIRRYTTPVVSVLRWAFQNDLIAQLPKIPKRPHVEYKHFIPPTQQELALIFANAQDHIRRVIIFGSQMGIRVGPSELFSLKWSDIDIENRVIHLRAAKKNKAEPIRNIPIREVLLKKIQAWRDEDSILGVEYVIHFRGKPIQSINTGWQSALRRAGIIRDIRPYDLRHAFATEAIAAGADIGTVAKLMGHASLTMVLKHYQHVLNSQKIAAIEALPEPKYVAENMWQNRKEDLVHQ